MASIFSRPVLCHVDWVMQFTMFACIIELTLSITDRMEILYVYFWFISNEVIICRSMKSMGEVKKKDIQQFLAGASKEK